MSVNSRDRIIRYDSRENYINKYFVHSYCLYCAENAAAQICNNNNNNVY